MYYAIGLFICIFIMVFDIIVLSFQLIYDSEELPKSKALTRLYRTCTRSKIMMYLVEKYNPLLFIIIDSFMIYPTLFFMIMLIMKG